MIARSLRRRGVLGINKRNLDYTQRWNPRRLLPRVDDKLATRELCRAAGMMDVCTLLFGADQAEQKFNDYFETEPGLGEAAPRRATRAMAGSSSESDRHGPQA